MSSSGDNLTLVDGIVLTFIIGFIPFLIITFLFSFRAVSAGKVGVVTQFGRVTGRTIEPGANFIVPYIQGIKTYSTKKVTYETTSEEKQKESDADYKDYPVDTNTSDGQKVDIFFTVRFSVDPTKAGWVTQNIGNEKDLVEKIVKTESRVWARSIPREYSADILYTGDGVVQAQNAIFEKLKPTFENNGLILDSFGIREVKFSDDYIKAVEAKQVEAVKIETARNQAEAAKFKKEQTITEAEAEAERQRLLQQSLSSEVLQNKFYEVWNGQLPQVITGESDLLLNITQ